MCNTHNLFPNIFSPHLVQSVVWNPWIQKVTSVKPKDTVREKGLKLETLTCEFGLCLLRECHSQLEQSQLFLPTCAGVVFLKGQGHGCINRRNDLLSCGKNYYLLRCSVAVTHISLWGNRPQDIWMEIWGPSLSLALSFLSKCFTLNGLGFREKLQQYTCPQPMSLVHTLFCDS